MMIFIKPFKKYGRNWILANHIPTYMENYKLNHVIFNVRYKFVKLAKCGILLMYKAAMVGILLIDPVGTAGHDINAKICTN
jgi:hypothetical protein